jgi:hypothetical protein
MLSYQHAITLYIRHGNQHPYLNFSNATVQDNIHMVGPDVDLAAKFQASTVIPPGPRAGLVTLMSELQPSVESVNCHQNEGRSHKRMYSSSENVLASFRNVVVIHLSVT